MINIVVIEDSKYHVDVGFGANGPIQPMKLDKSGTVEKHISPATCRLQWRNIDANTDPGQRLWVFEHCIDEESDFQTIYCFTELEFLPSDYKVMNHYTSTAGTTFFTRVIVGVKQILGDGGEIIGSLILGNNDLKWRIHGSKTKEVKFESEDDRVRALEEYFGIKLSQAEKDGITGLPSEIKSR
jgi:arylamine N-acetyltransferase